MNLTREKLKEALEYNPETGKFFWKIRTSKRIHIGDEAGCLAGNGHILIRMYGKLYQASRLAWLYVYGENPLEEIDHKDVNSSNNKIDNLRLATRMQNQWNTRVTSRSKTGIKGVCWNKSSNKWHVQINHNNQRVYSAYFDDLNETKEAMLREREKWHSAFSRVA
jgi:hypothetical protein